MKIHLIATATCLLTLSATAMAGSAVPPPPALGIFQSTATCNSYVNSVGKYLKKSSKTFWDGMFFSLLAQRTTGHDGGHLCQNGSCEFFLDFNHARVGSSGQDRLCYLAAHGSAAIQNNFLNNYLAPDYQTAVIEQGSIISNPIPIEGFYGPESTCSYATLNQCSIAATLPAPSQS